LYNSFDSIGAGGGFAASQQAMARGQQLAPPAGDAPNGQTAATHIRHTIPSEGASASQRNEIKTVSDNGIDRYLT